MKSKVLIVFAQDGKKKADNIVSKLRENQFDCTYETSSMQDIGVAVVVMTKGIDSDATAIKVSNYCDKNQIALIPFVSEKQGKSLTADYFLNNHLWIDNIEVPLNDSVEDLVDLMKNNFGILVTKGGKKIDKLTQQKQSLAKNISKSKASSSATSSNIWKALTYIFGFIIVILVAVIALSQDHIDQQLQQATASGSQLPVQNLSTTLRTSENPFVGHWVMVEYSDNQYRPTKDDSLQLQQSVAQMIGRCQMVFNQDKTFSRIGFAANPEKGTWEYDPSSAYLKLMPTGGKQYDVVQIQEIKNDKMILVVSEKVDNSDIITKITFKRQN